LEVWPVHWLYFLPIAGWRILDYYKGLGNIGAGYNILFIICGLAYFVAWLIIHFLTGRMKPVEESLKD
jgi:ACS family hexuronate transporter-like MFS transporter